jgi:hypothetical protein
MNKNYYGFIYDYEHLDCVTLIFKPIYKESVEIGKFLEVQVKKEEQKSFNYCFIPKIDVEENNILTDQILLAFGCVKGVNNVFYYHGSIFIDNCTTTYQKIKTSKGEEAIVMCGSYLRLINAKSILKLWRPSNWDIKKGLEGNKDYLPDFNADWLLSGQDKDA